MAPRGPRRKRAASADQSDGASDDEDALPERVKEITQCALASHSHKGGMRDNEVKKTMKDAVRITREEMKDVLGCKLTKDGDRFFLSYEKALPRSIQGNSDIIAEAKQGLLSVVLMFIHMSKDPLVKTDKVKEIALWEFLAMLEVVQYANHPVFGLPSKLIAPNSGAEFVAQGWLSFEKRKGDRNDADDIVYDWGPRAFAVINPQEILESFCEIVGDKAEEWKEHFKLGRKNQTSSITRSNDKAAIDID